MNHMLRRDLVHYTCLVFLAMQFVGCFLCSSSVWAMGISNLSEEKKIASNSVQSLIFVLLVEIFVSCVFPLLDNLFLSSKKLISLLESLQVNLIAGVLLLKQLTQ